MVDLNHVNNWGYASLAEANDSGVPFSVLADFIEENPEAVFTETV